MKKLWIAAVLLFAVGAQAEEWKKEYTVAPGSTLRVQTNDARIEVHGGSGNTVSMHVTTEGWHIGPGDVTVYSNQTSNGVSLQVKIPNRHFGINFGGRSVRVEVTVPQQTSVDLTSSDGSLQLANTKGEARLNTSDGSIRIDGFEGVLHARTSDGSIEVAGVFTGLDLSTSDGHITAELREGSKLSGPANLRTSDGSITVRVPSQFPADVDASTSDGRITLDMPMEVSGQIAKNRVRGRINGGGQLLQVHTSDGSIHLSKL